MKRKVLLRDLAEAEGVSISQASRALRQRPGVNPELRERLLTRARELDYHNTSTRHRYRIAFFGVASGIVSPFLPDLAREVGKRGWLYFSLAADQYELLDDLYLDGIFFLGYHPLSVRLPEQIKQFPVVMVNDYSDTLESIASVIPDAEGECELALRHLTSLGHRRIARIRSRLPEEPQRWSDRGLRSFYRIARELGIGDSVQDIRYDSGGYEKAVGAALASGITALIDVAHESTPLLALLREQRIRVPEDLSIIAYENPASSAWQPPPLTTIAFDTPSIARDAVRLMEEEFHERNSRTIVVPSKLIVRESTAPVAALCHPEMTKHYQAHADREAKEKYLAQMPDFIGHAEVKAIGSPNDSLREELIQQIKELPTEKLESVAYFLRSL